MGWSSAIDCSDAVALPARTGQQDPPLWRLLGQICRALKRDVPIAHRYLLLLRFVLANVIAFALVGAAAGQGWISALLAADEGGLVHAIIAVFLVGLVWSGQRAVLLSRGLNELERFARFRELRRPLTSTPLPDAPRTAGRSSPRPCGSSSRAASPRSGTWPTASCCSG